MIEWNEEEIEEGRKAWRAAVPSLDVNHVALLAAMTRAVELAAARGGTLTAGQVRGSLATLPHPDDRTMLGEHLDALSARNAVLEAERDTWRQCAEERQLAAQQQMADKHSLVTERDALKAELAALSETYKRTDQRANAAENYVDALRETDRACLEQLAHALGWKDGGPGWQAAIDEVRRLAGSGPPGQVAEDEAMLALCCRSHSERARLSRLAAGAQRAITLQQHLDNLRAMKWKCQDGHPIDLAVIVEGATP
jgi:hypothetical protein